MYIKEDANIIANHAKVLVKIADDIKILKDNNIDVMGQTMLSCGVTIPNSIIIDSKISEYEMHIQMMEATLGALKEDWAKIKTEITALSL